MKKYLLFILLLVIPFFVKAFDLEVEKIEFVEKSKYTEIIEDATIKNNKINLNVRFQELNDYVKYKITLKNNTDKTYDTKTTKDLTEYVTANFESVEDDEGLIKANSTKEVYFIIKYNHEVPLEEFQKNPTITTDDIQSLELSVKEDKVNVEVNNPKTNTFVSIVLAVVLITSGISAIILTKNKQAFLVLAIMIISIPLTIYAIEQIKIDIDSKIEISHPYFKVLGFDGKPAIFLFDRGMTWQEFVDSDYNTSQWKTTPYIYARITAYVNGEPQYEYTSFEDDKLGIYNDITSIDCGSSTPPLGFLNYHLIRDNNINNETTDMLIKDGYTYNFLGEVTC